VSTADRVKLLILVLIVGAGAALVVVGAVPDVAQIRRQVQELGPVAPVAFALAYAVLSLIPSPASALTIAAGAVFGLVTGLATVLFGATLGATGAFLISRYLGGQFAARHLGTRFTGVEALVRERGFTAVLVLRLVPLVPFSALNYLCGLSGLRVRTYVSATAVGIVPGTAAYVAVGAFGVRPGSPPFLLAIGGLAVLTILGSVAARELRTSGLSV
jgi:uncharacterized membrane protein YdjX (TVP38/TMEM64 family)